MIADGDDRNERWHEHGPTRWWIIELAVMKSLLAVSKLPGVYCEETQIMSCYLYMIANYANVTYSHKYYVVNAWAIISGFLIKNHLLSPKHSQRPSLKFEWNRLVSPRFEWTLKFERSPRIEGITLRSPRIECFTYFWGWSSTWLRALNKYDLGFFDATSTTCNIPRSWNSRKCR